MITRCKTQEAIRQAFGADFSPGRFERFTNKKSAQKFARANNSYVFQVISAEAKKSCYQVNLIASFEAY